MAIDGKPRLVNKWHNQENSAKHQNNNDYPANCRMAADHPAAHNRTGADKHKHRDKRSKKRNAYK